MTDILYWIGSIWLSGCGLLVLLAVLGALWENRAAIGTGGFFVLFWPLWVGLLITLGLSALFSRKQN